MENDKHFSNVWRALFIVGSIAAAVYAVDNRYVTDVAFSAFKDGTISALIARLDRIESKLDSVIAEQHR